MKELMLKKIELEETTFTDIEVEWLMKNIGNEDAEIRDFIVFILLANGIVDGGFTKQQFEYIKNKTVNENLMFFKIDKGLPFTLTRSFSILLNGFIIEADGLESSPYYHSLTDSERNYFFKSAETYLYEEKDRISYSKEYGWVHSFGHFGDYLIKVINHDLYKIEDFPKILDSIYYMLKHLEKSFEFGEERRLAHAIYIGLLNKKISQEMLVIWLEKLDFPLIDNKDYYPKVAFENFLAYIYFKAMDSFELRDSLKTTILKNLKDYSLF